MVWDSDDERDEMIGQCTINFQSPPCVLAYLVIHDAG